MKFLNIFNKESQNSKIEALNPVRKHSRKYISKCDKQEYDRMEQKILDEAPGYSESSAKKSKPPNKYETTLYLILWKYFPNEWRITTAEPNLKFGRHRPDFTHTKNNWLIELFGEPWHPRQCTYKPRCNCSYCVTLFYHQREYNCLVIWWDELADLDTLTKKIKFFFY